MWDDTCGGCGNTRHGDMTCADCGGSTWLTLYEVGKIKRLRAAGVTIRTAAELDAAPDPAASGEPDVCRCRHRVADQMCSGPHPIHHAVAASWARREEE